MGSITVLYVHQDGLLTGSAISLRNLLIGLDLMRFSPRVLLGQEGPARQLYEGLNIAVDMLPIRGMWTFPGPRFPTPDYFRNWLALLPNRELEAYLKRLDPDLVHINDKTMLPVGVAARRLGLPVVWHLRSSYAVSHSRLQARISSSLIHRAADKLIAISEDETDGFDDLSNLSIIYNSVDFDQVSKALQQSARIRIELGLGADEMLVGTVSTAINENRGSWDFIQAMGLLKALLPAMPLRFLLVGKISNCDVEKEVWARAAQAGISEQLILTGFRSDALALMAAMSVVIICTRRGVLGRMPFEAMALGRPLVVTAGHSGRSRVVVNGETSLVVPPANPNAIADGTAHLLQSPELCSRLANQGKAYAHRHFDPQKNAQAVMKIYEDVLH